MKDFFISYNSHDKEWAEWIAWILEERGFSTVIQAWDFRPGGNFVLEMHKAALNTKHTIAVLSDEYVNAAFTQPEWAAAFVRDPQGNERTLIPVRVSLCRPVGLLSAHIYVDLVGLSADEAESALINSTNARGKPIERPPYPGATALPSSLRASRPGELRLYPGRQSDALAVWQEKLEFLRAQQASLSDASQKLTITKQIEEVENKLAEMVPQQSFAPSNSRAPGQSHGYLSERTQHVREEIRRAYIRRTNLASVGEDTNDIDREIIALKREFRQGGQIKRGDHLGANGRYLLIDSLGCGGFATVWRARDTLRNEDVAVKVLRNMHIGNTIYEERFRRGARIMSALADNDGIVKVLERDCEDDGFHYFVMELLQGGNLHEATIEHRIGASDAVAIMDRMLEILSNAYSSSGHFVHRDVKPTNVLLTGDHKVKLSDFDLVAVHDTTGGTQTGPFGTLKFAAPEQLERPQDADHRADIYSVALTGMFVLYGRELPFEILGGTKRLIRRLPTSAPIKEVLIRATERKREHRFASAEEFRIALREGLLGSDIAAAPPPSAIDSSMFASERQMRKQKKRYVIPKVKSAQVREAMRMFDTEHRDERRWRHFASNPKHTYGILFDGKVYPVKKIMSLASGIPIGNFSGGAALNRRVAELGFDVVRLREGGESQN